MERFRPRNLDVPEKQLADFCRRWRICELALFGSVLRDDFDRDSDLDLLATFAPDAKWGLLDHVQMEEELEALLGRDVDLLSRRAVERSQNWIRRQSILDSAAASAHGHGRSHQAALRLLSQPAPRNPLASGCTHARQAHSRIQHRGPG
jgi:predicted nucleotidyltransferase